MSRFAVVPITLVALLVLLAGTGGAVARGLITGKDIKNGTVGGADVRDGSLGSVDLSATTRAALRGPQGPAGVQGLQGTQGLQGAPGVPGDPASLSDGYQVVRATGSASVDGAPAVANAYCPSGTWAVGGGGSWEVGNPGTNTININQPVVAARDQSGTPTGSISLPTTYADAWRVEGLNQSGGPAALAAFVICVPAAG